MVRIFTFLLFIFYSLLSYGQQDYEVTAGTFLNIRSSASGNAPVVGTVNKGGTVSVYEIKGEWARISYNNKEAYVSSKFIKPAAAGKNIAAADSGGYRPSWYYRAINYVDDNWSWIGWIILWIIVPLLFAVLFIGIPVFLLGLVRLLPNWVCKIICYIFAISIVAWYTDFLQGSNVYTGTFASPAIWILNFILAYGVIKGVYDGRCPFCHDMNSSLINSFTETKRYKHTTTWSDGTRDVSYSSTDTEHNQHQCQSCGSTWWTRG